MLKLEKARNREINVNIRSKERRCNSLFLKALGIAVGLHLLAIVFFQIHHWISRGDMILPPIKVETDLSGSEDSDGSLLAYAESEGRSARHLLTPPPSMPHLPEMPKAHLERHMEYIKENSTQHNPFLCIEEDWNHLVEGKRQKAKGKIIEDDERRKIIVRVTGDLRHIPLLNDGLPPDIECSNRSEQYLAVYDVKVERKTGRVFWFSPLKKTGLDDLENQAELILKQMQFEDDPNYFVGTGEVEIIFNG